MIIKSNAVKVIYDNTISFDDKESSALLVKPVMTISMIEKAYTEAADEYASNKNYEVTSQFGKLVYNIEKGCMVYRVRTEYYLNNETFYVDIFDSIVE